MVHRMKKYILARKQKKNAEDVCGFGEIAGVSANKHRFGSKKKSANSMLHDVGKEKALDSLGLSWTHRHHLCWEHWGHHGHFYPQHSLPGSVTSSLWGMRSLSSPVSEVLVDVHHVLSL